MSKSLSYWDALVVAIYMLWMLGIGIYYSKRQTDTNEYFLGRRSMNWFIVGISTMATLISTITYLTMPGEVIANGFGVLWSQLSVWLSFFFIGYLVIPKIMEHKITSGYQLLEKQFGMGIRQAAAVLFILTRITWTGLVVYTCSRAVSQMTRWPLESVILAVGIITISYTTMGGIRAVIITDVTQAFILFGGALAVVAFAIYSSGSLTGWWPNFHDPVIAGGLSWPNVKLFSFDLTERITVLGIIFMYIVWWICTASSDQLAIQRYLSTRDARMARRSFLTNAFANTMVASVLAFCGAALVGYFIHNPSTIPAANELLLNAKPGVLDEVVHKMSMMGEVKGKLYLLKRGADDVFPWFIAHVLPTGLSGVLIAALFSAAMSSVSSGVNSITTVIMVDFARIFSRSSDERQRVRKAKLIGIIVGAIAILVSFVQHFIKGNFMEVAQKINGCFIAPMAALFIMAFFIKRINRQGAWAAIFSGFVIGAVVSYYGEISKALTGNEVKVSFMFILPFSLVGAIVAAYLVSLLFPAPFVSNEQESTN
ncbi:MAG: sodium/solute symporter [Armatimonadetes bacterium]|nr:sodium/solute symporter [Armatimonadota bacterium]